MKLVEHNVLTPETMQHCTKCDSLYLITTELIPGTNQVMGQSTKIGSYLELKEDGRVEEKIEQGLFFESTAFCCIGV